MRLIPSLLPLLALLSAGPRHSTPRPRLGAHTGGFRKSIVTTSASNPPRPAGAGYEIGPLIRHLEKPTLKREVFGYLPYWFANRWNLLDYELVSTIAYFSAEVNTDGTIGSVHGWPRSVGDPSASADVVAMINAAHDAGVRVVLCLTNFDSGSLALLLASPAYRTTLIQQSLALVEAGGGDGINVNFEGIPSAEPR